MSQDTRPIMNIGHEGTFLANLDIPGRPTNFVYIVCLILFTMLGGIFYEMYSGQYTPAVFIPQIIVLIGILTMWAFRRVVSPRPHNWLSPDVAFVAVFCVFHFSYIAFYTLGLAEADDEVFLAPTKVLRATFYCICCLVVFLAGYEIIGGRFRDRDSAGLVTPASPKLIAIGKVIIVIAVLSYWGTLFYLGIGRVLSDYEMLSRINLYVDARIFYMSFVIGPLGLAIYCAASGLLYQKCMKGRVFAIGVLAFIVMIMLLGDRSGFLTYAIIPIMGFYYLQQKIKLRWAVTGVLLLFAAMGIVRYARATVVLNPAKIVQEYKYERETKRHNVIIETALEFGASLKVVVIGMGLVPERYPYWYGGSYVDAAKMIVPNIIPGYYRVPKYKSDAWITETAFGTRTHGRGGSVAMEAYLNFGFIGGVLFLVFLGGLYRFLYELFLRKPNFVRTTLILGASSALVIYVRGTAEVFIRPVVWAWLVPWAMQFFLPKQEYEDLLQTPEY